MVSDFAFGVLMNLFGSISINLGTNIMKLSHLQSQGRGAETCSFLQQLFGFSTWSTGVTVFACGNVMNFVSFAFAAQSLLAALGSVQFISNVIFAVFLLKERAPRSTVLAISLIVFGNIMIVTNGSRASRKPCTAAEMYRLYTTVRYQRYLLTIALLVVLLHGVYKYAKMHNFSHDAYFRVLPFSYAAVSAIVGSQSVLLAKSTSEHLRSSLEGHGPLICTFFFVILAGWVCTMVFWLYRMNMALRKFDSMFIVPVLQVIWTLFSIIGGGLYFNEFHTFTVFQALRFVSGVGLVIAGVFVLANNSARGKTPSSQSKTNNTATDDDDSNSTNEDDVLTDEEIAPLSPALSPHTQPTTSLLLFSTAPRSVVNPTTTTKQNTALSPPPTPLRNSLSPPSHMHSNLLNHHHHHGYESPLYAPSLPSSPDPWDLNQSHNHTTHRHNHHHHHNHSTHNRSNRNRTRARVSSSFSLAFPMFDFDADPLAAPVVDFPEDQIHTTHIHSTPYPTYHDQPNNLPEQNAPTHRYTLLADDCSESEANQNTNSTHAVVGGLNVVVDERVRSRSNSNPGPFQQRP